MNLTMPVKSRNGGGYAQNSPGYRQAFADVFVAVNSLECPVVMEIACPDHKAAGREFGFQLLCAWDLKNLARALDTDRKEKRCRNVDPHDIFDENSYQMGVNCLTSLSLLMPPLKNSDALQNLSTNQLELIVDGGIRRGTHIIKALALGANACSIGRPYVYGLAAGGQQGVEHALLLLKNEVERSMALLGVKSIQEINRSHLFDKTSNSEVLL